MDVEEFVRSKLVKYFVDGHVITVVKEAAMLCDFYPRADKEVVRIGAFLHDVGHVCFGADYYDDNGKSVDPAPHNIRSVAISKPYLEGENLPKEQVTKILHCIEAHRTSQPPTPETIEAKIVASADNLAHFVDFDDLSSKMGLNKSVMKLKRDLAIDFMLPEALDRAKKLTKEIEIKYDVKVL